jgi:hypothetical protein
MSDAIPTQHPAVVLRSHYQHLRALLAVAMIAVVGLTAAVVILATRDRGSSTIVSPARVASPVIPAGSQAGATIDHRGLNAAPGPTTRYDGGPEEGTRGVTPNPTTRYDGGPEEGTRGALAPLAPPSSQPQAPSGGNATGQNPH